MSRPPIIFSRVADSLEFTGSRGYHAKHLPLCRHKWKLYRDGVFVSRHETFNELGPAALRDEALRLRRQCENLT